MTSHSWKAWLLLALLAFIWGSSFWLIKQGLHEFSSMQVALIRMIVAAACLMPFAIKAIQHQTLPWVWLIVIGLIGSVIPAILFAIAQQVIPSALAGMLNTLQPIFTIIVGALAFQQSIRFRQIVGLLIGFAGSIILLSVDFQKEDFGTQTQFSLLVVLATFCYGFSTNIVRYKCAGVSPIAIASLSLNIFLIPCALWLWIIGIPSQPWQSNIGIALFYLFLLGAIGTAFALILFNRLIHRSGTLFASTVTYLIPIVATVWGVADDEPISLLHMLAISIIIVGVYIMNSVAENKKHARRADA